MSQKTVQQERPKKWSRGVTMRMRVGKEILTIILAATLLAAIWSCGNNDNNDGAGQASIVYYGGTIITMEDAQPTAEAVVAGEDGRIAFVGDRETAFRNYPGAQRIDLEDRTLMPGFIEPHLHVDLGALNLSIAMIATENWELPGGKIWPAAEGKDDYQEKIKSAFEDWKSECSKSDMKPNEKNFFSCDIFWTWGFNAYFHGEGWMNRDFLDSHLSEDIPIAVWGRSDHEFYVNSGFVDLFDIDQEGINDIGQLAIDASNLDEGHFWENGLMLYLAPLIMDDLASHDRLRFGMNQMVKMLHENGVTAYLEPGARVHHKDLYEEILGAEDTPMYTFFIPQTQDPYNKYYDEDGKCIQNPSDPDLCKQEMLKEVEETAKTFDQTGKVRFLQDAVKIFFDGAIISLLMVMDPGYNDNDPPGTHVGSYIQPPEETDTITKIFWDAGYQIVVHVNGDGALQELIEILRRRQQQQPRQDHRFTIIHFATSKEEQIPELAELGAIITANPYYVTGFGKRFGEVGGLGADRAHSMVRLAPAEKLGIPISLHSDLPMAPASPLFLAWSAATRHTNEWTENSLPGEATLRPDLALSRDAALRAITIEGAYAWRMEDSLGSIKWNKIANFTILEENPYDVELDKLKDIEVYATVFEGRLFPVD